MSRRRPTSARAEEVRKLAVLNAKAARKAAGLSLAEMGERLGIADSGVAIFERETSNPTISTLAIYAEALGMTLVIDFVGPSTQGLSTQGLSTQGLSTQGLSVVI